MTRVLDDSFTKAQTEFNQIHGEDWQRHVHPADRDELCGYLIRMVSDRKEKFNAWNATTARPKGVVKLNGAVKTLVRCTGGRSYFVECKAITSE